MKGKKASAVVVAAVTFALTMAATGAGAATRTAPVVKTLAVSAVTSSSATLNGSVNPGGLATTAWFQWQPADGDNSTTRTVGAGTTPVTYSSTITGLKPATSYKYEAAAINSKGTRYGTLVTFTTAAVVTPPAGEEDLPHL